MSSSISHVPDDVLKYIFSFVGMRDHRAVTGTSERFRQVYCSDKPIVLLSNDLLNEIFSFVGEGDYRFVAGTCRWFQQVYASEDEQKETTWANVALSVGRANLYWEDADEIERPNYRRQGDLRDIFKAAVKAGQVDLLNWTLSRGFTLEQVQNNPGYYLRSAVEEGHVNVLEWADAHNVEWYDANSTPLSVAFYPNVNVLDYILEHKSPNLEGQIIWVMTQTAMEDNLIPVLQWMKDRSILPAGLVKQKLRFGSTNLELLGFAYDNGCLDVASILGNAFMFKRFAVLQWMKDRNILTANLVKRCAMYGHDMEVMGWVYDNGYDMFQHDADYLVRKEIHANRDNAIQWLQKRQTVPFSAAICELAAEKGDLPLLQCLREKGSPWDCRVLRAARLGGFKYLEKWAIANGCPHEPSDLLHFLAMAFGIALLAVVLHFML